MEKIKCTTIQDILPLYVDDVVCEDTKELVDEHICTCENCARLVNNMKKDINMSSFAMDESEDIEVVKKIKKSIKSRIIKAIFATIAIIFGLYIVFLLVFSLSLEFGIVSKPHYVKCDIADEVEWNYEEKENHGYGYTIHNYDGLKSDNPDDYMEMDFYVKVSSYSLNDNQQVDAVFSEVKYFEENLLYSFSQSLDIGQFVDTGSSNILWVKLYVYVGDMTDEDIDKFIDGVTIDVISGGDVRKVNFSQCDVVVY